MTAPAVSCLIPAFNEAARIGAVLRAVTDHPGIAEVIVIDDGSSDATAQIVRQTAGVTLISLPQNRGKTWALAAGIAAARHPLLLLVDSDLVGLETRHLSALIGVVTSGRADVGISLRQNAPGLWRGIGLDYLSGERILPRAQIAGRIDALRQLPKFGFEVFLNRIWIDQNARIGVVRWPGVHSPSKSAKRGLWPGVQADLHMMRDIFRTVAPAETARQIRAMMRQRVG
ncbi:glycosyltransferase [Paracoccaceae bacterium Fryx2]|nr:glycosyltransferase [Paracoccaceae bacterium Fryx2]